MKIADDRAEKMECQDIQMNAKDMEILALKDALKTRESLVEQADELFLLSSQRFTLSEKFDPPAKKMKRSVGTYMW